MFRRNPDMVFRRVAGEGIIVPVTRATGSVECIYSLNETAARIWELIDGGAGVEDICAAVCAEFDVPAGQARADIDDFLRQMLSINAVCPCSAPA